MKARGKVRLRFPVAVAVGAVLALAGCGGGGGGGGAAGSSAAGVTSSQAVQTVSGVAAAGAALGGSAMGAGYVYLKDSGNPATTLGPNQIASDGSYSFDVTGLTPPFYLQAVGSVGGQSFQLFSVATAAGTTNINPLTTLAVAAAAGTSDPADVFNNPAQHPVTQASLASAVGNIQQTLAPLFTAYSASTDFMSGSYTANGTGLDQVFDTTNVTLNTTAGTVTVTNKVTGSTILPATQTASLSSATVNTANIPTPTVTDQTTTDMQGIQARLAALMALINTGAQAANVDPFFAGSANNPAPFGINDGRDRAGEISVYVAWLNAQPSGATLIGTPTVSLTQAGAGTYTVGATTALSDGTVYSTNPDGEDSFIFVSESGVWKLMGNGYKSSFNRNPFRAASYEFILPGSSSQPVTVTGLALDARDDGNSGSGYGLQTAFVCGPGLLPAAVYDGSGNCILGVPIGKLAGPDGIDLVPLPPYRVPGVIGWQPYTDVYTLDDTAIAAIPDNAVYTYTFYNINGAVVETRTMTLPKRPLLSTELTSAFPTLSGVTSHSLSSVPVSGALNFGYTTAPVSAFAAVGLHSALQFWDNAGNSTEFDQALAMSQASSSITIAPPVSLTPAGARLDLTASDVFRREMHVQWIFGQ